MLVSLQLTVWVSFNKTVFITNTTVSTLKHPPGGVVLRLKWSGVIKRSSVKTPIYNVITANLFKTRVMMKLSLFLSYFLWLEFHQHNVGLTGARPSASSAIFPRRTRFVEKWKYTPNTTRHTTQWLGNGNRNETQHRAPCIGIQKRIKMNDLFILRLFFLFFSLTLMLLFYARLMLH